MGKKGKPFKFATVGTRVKEKVKQVGDALDAVDGMVAEPAIKKRRCDICNAFLRTSNKSDPPRCCVCMRKSPPAKSAIWE